MYKRLMGAAFAVIALAMVLSFLPIHGESELYSSVLRLHVIANSDSDADQELKLKVRDAVLSKSKEILCGATSREEAAQRISDACESLRACALAAVREAGYEYGVSIELGVEEYPTRNYESCCFPAGKYLSLRIKLGDAEGKNWWCVLFPPLCLSAAGDSAEGFIEAGLSGEQYNIITETSSPKYKVRFKLLEALQNAVE